jgi:hypothetical protein
MKSRERQQIGLKLSPLAAEKLVEFLVTISPKAKGLSCAILKKYDSNVQKVQIPQLFVLSGRALSNGRQISEAHLPLNNLASVTADAVDNRKRAAKTRKSETECSRT